jgi:aldehyde:ferredoxin oxidoreductase
VAVRRRNPPELTDPERVKEMAGCFARQIKEDPPGLSVNGTGAAMDVGAETANLPPRNIRDGEFWEAPEIDAIAVKTGTGSG